MAHERPADALHRRAGDDRRRNPWGISEYFKIDYLPELPDAAIDALVDKSADSHSPFTAVYLCALGGAIARTDRTAMALEVPDAKWFYFCEALWTDPADAEAETAWAHAFMETMRPWGVNKAPANFISADEVPTRLAASYGAEKYQRLRNLKDAFDPANVFALNQNIPPNADSASTAAKPMGPNLPTPSADAERPAGAPARSSSD